MYVRWSPKGAYLATLHTKGIALWAGEKFKQVQRFIHQGVCFVDFSPCERSPSLNLNYILSMIRFV